MYKITMVFLLFYLFTQSFHAQIIRIEEAWDDTKGNSSVCGKIENGQLTIPSYKFKVTDKNGNILKNLRSEGELVITESVWKKNGLFDLDPYWEDINHSIQIPIVYDSKAEVYSTQEVSRVSIAKRRKKGKRCLDKIIKLNFSFYQNDCDSTMFVFFFPNRTVDKINLPSSEKIYNLGVIEGYSCIKRESEQRHN